jgi:hypothetical protein
MKKKITAILVAILLCSVSGASIVLAKQETEQKGIGCIGDRCIIPPPYPPKPRYPDVKIARGVAVNKYTSETEPVVFLIMNYNGQINTYLFINGKFYEMTEIERSGSLETGTKVFKYKSSDGSIMTVVIQHFETYNVVSIVADFKDYLINFEPINEYGSRPLTANEGITSTLTQPVYKEISQKLKQASGINMEDIFSKPTGQITEWTE